MATSQMMSVVISRIATNPPNWSAQRRSVTPVNALNKAISVMFGGLYRVAGTAAVSGSPDIPVKRRVGLFDEKSGRIARVTLSDPVNGGYSFDFVSAGPWTVLAWDHTGEYNAVVASNRFGDRI